MRRVLTGVALSQAAPARAVLKAAMPPTVDFLYSPVGVIAKAVREREISSTELVTSYLQRIENVNPWLNAVVTVVAESALAKASTADTLLARGTIVGPLHGVPMTIKDSLDTRGVATAWGVPAREGFVPDQDATVVRRLLAAGAILLGKTNTPELTLSFETNSPIHGPTNNPYDVTRTAGGSSGGAAAIVAAGGTPFDIGSDTGGSVRLPAHFCGVSGIRPTSGRVPRTGNAIPPGGALDRLSAIGPIGRHVEDLGLLLSIISGPDSRDPGSVPMPDIEPSQLELKRLRATFHTDNGIRAPTKASIDAVIAAANCLARNGVIVEEGTPPGIEDTLEIFQSLFDWDGGAWRRALLEQAAAGPGTPQHDLPVPSNRKTFELFERWNAFRKRMRDFMSRYDLLLCPVNAFPALPHGQAADQIDAFSYTMTYSLTDWPAAVVRAGTSPDGLPIGVQLVARSWREDIVLAAAQEIDKTLGGWQPPQI